MNFAEAASLLLIAVPPLSLAGIAASATARQRSHRLVFGVLGWIGWLLTVAAAVFFGLVIVALSCWGDTTSCGEGSAALVLFGGVVAAVLPGVVAYGLTARVRAARR